jgi:hypothetical protein
MQLSAANLLIASQQAAKATPRPDAKAFAAAMEKAAFEPLAFKEVAAAPKAAPQVQPTSQPPAQNAFARLGSQLDIKV